MKRNNIILQMFDVRPINRDGVLDLEKINSVKDSFKKEVLTDQNSVKTIKNILPYTSDIIITKKETAIFNSSQVPNQEKKDLDEKKYIFHKTKGELLQSGNKIGDIKKFEIKLNELPYFQNKLPINKNVAKGPVQKQKISFTPEGVENIKKATVEFSEKMGNDYFGEKEYANHYTLENSDYFEKFQPQKKKKIKKEKERGFSLGDIFYYERYFRPWPKMKLALSFAGTVTAFLLIFFGITTASKGVAIKDTAYLNSNKALASLVSAKNDLANKNFQSAAINFDQAYGNLDKISRDINSLGEIIVESSKYFPYLSKLSSGSNLTEAGKDLSKVGILISENINTLEKIKSPINSEQSGVSYLKIFEDTKENLNKIVVLLKDAQEKLDAVNADDIPEKNRNEFIVLRKNLPQATKFLSEFVANEKIFTDILGGNGPRKYLFLFENNQEMRATGGFIGTYAVMDIFNGRVRNFFVDGIFNPDGQLQERIVPPAPIQKISANWSMHDSNWFPDFPVSAEKATFFYEKTGGPTVDGVIAITPAVLKKLLAVTGPIEMSEYGITIDENNFIENIQTEVEQNYDKELNQPKKILSDITPKILDKIFNPDDFSDLVKTMGILSDSLNEKHILIYAKNWEIQKVLSTQGWSGEVLDSQKDYISVINTNINGFKTDGVIDEKIKHVAKIQEDGSIIDTVTITRHHNGGNTPYDWWNKVNADYMRVYVPKGSKLISASGQTREFNSPPLDYDALGYKKDPQVKMEEDSIFIDEDSGTRIYEDSNKTVFANWVYVSPQETVEVNYTYLLPFKINTDLEKKLTDTYSLLAQKQSGSSESSFSSEVVYPDFYKILWKYPDGLENIGNSVKVETNLKTDKFIGIAFSKK